MVLITGGSEGIGLELAKLYAARGFSLILVGRSMEKLKQAEKTLSAKEVHLIAMDLSVRLSAMDLYDKVKQIGSVDILINNAGVGYNLPALQTGIEEDEALIQLNDATVISLCKLFGKDMLEKHQGRVFNIGSTGAFQPGPGIASYYASKAFLVNYTEALHQEWQGSGVSITCFCPGPVDTAFYPKSHGKLPPLAWSAADTAAYIVNHETTTKAVVVIGWMNRISCVLPKGLRSRIVRYIKEKQ